MLKPTKRLTKKQIKEDKLVTTYFKVMDYIEQNQKIVIIGTVSIIVVALAIILFMRSKRNAELSASLELTKARVEIQQNNLESATDILTSLVDNYKGTENAGRGVFYLGNINYSQGDLEAAMKYYKDYIDDYKDNDILASSAYAGLAACYEQKGEYLEAAKIYEKAAREFPKNFQAPEQLMAAARCYRLANVKNKAHEIYQKVIDDYPNSNFKKDAEVYVSMLQS
ncbi:tetratricopeptide repeat protein [candidate division KSB1 bacterium]|nr:tetratricopeptide repeat protein [candidate division KSB1 bacterium]